MSQKIIILFSVAILVIVAIFLANSLILAWNAPGSSPPDSNADKPINVGSGSQYKAGALGIGGVFHGYSDGVFDGDVGVGVTNPQAKLDINGGIKVGDVSTCDSSTEGAIRFNGSDFQGCDGSQWLSLTQ